MEGTEKKIREVRTEWGGEGEMGRGNGKAERVNWDINDAECDRFNEAV